MIYDIALADEQGFFAHRVRELCGANNLTFFLVEPLWVEGFLDKLKCGDISVGVLIDMISDPNPTNLYYRLAREVKASGGHVIDDPDRSPLTTDKAKFHDVLLKNNIPVPETILVHRDNLSTFHLSEEEKTRLGMPFVVKPGSGYGRRGVNLNACTEADILKSAEQAPQSEYILLQKRVTPRTLDGRPAWLRIYYACGEIIPCWWHPSTGDYFMVSPLQRHAYNIMMPEQMVYKIAQLSHMEFFSTEICITQEGKFVVVDYLNDECDTQPKSYWPSGPPDEVVRRIAWLMVNKAISTIHKHPFANDLMQRDRDWHLTTQ